MERQEMPLEGSFRFLELCLYSITELVFQTWSGPIWSVAVRVLWVFLSNYLLHSRRLFWHGTGAAGQSEQSAGNYINMKQHSWMRGNVNLLCSDTSQSSSHPLCLRNEERDGVDQVQLTFSGQINLKNDRTEIQRYIGAGRNARGEMFHNEFASDKSRLSMACTAN